MIFLNKTIILPTMESLFLILTKNYYVPPKTCFYSDRIAIKQYIRNDLNIVRVWKTKSLLDVWYDDFNSEHFLGAIDYNICNDKIKIEYMNINDYNSCLNQKFKLNDIEAMELNSALIEFVKTVAAENKKPKIVVDVHNNLRIFNKYYNYKGFEITNRKSIDTPLWLEADMRL